MAIHESELNPETRAKLLKKADLKRVPLRTIVLGKLLVDIDGLTTRDALWALRTAHAFVCGHRKIKTKTLNRPKATPSTRK